MDKYSILINIIDRIREEAPEQYKFYHPDEKKTEEMIHARSKAFVHLFLKVKFGLLDFLEREKYVTDGANDGGIDGYFIDKKESKIYIIQAKFRASTENFEKTYIDWHEITKMHIGRIISEGKAYDKDVKGIKYNGKIINLIKEIKELKDPRFKVEVILLANFKESLRNELPKLTDNFPVEVFDYKKSYEELVFPVVSGTLYNEDSFLFEFDLSRARIDDISYNVETEHQNCSIKLLFIPTLEIAKLMYRYKNSVLHHNPRSYQGSEANQNEVNNDIQNSIVNKDHNEFALFNNGITIISDDSPFNVIAGKAYLTVTNPQIINGGQTAYTLSKIYEDSLKNDNLGVFKGKEVLVKIIDFTLNNSKDKINRLKFINQISKTTNNQTPIQIDDLISNDPRQIEIQEYIYDNFGLFYERKSGQYYEGIIKKYIYKQQIIDKTSLFRIALACHGKPNWSRGLNKKKIFSGRYYDSILNSKDLYRHYIFGFFCKRVLESIHNIISDESKLSIYAIISVASKQFNKDIDFEKYHSEAKRLVSEIAPQMKAFENFVAEKAHNSKYFKTQIDEKGKEYKILNFHYYYKGTTLMTDLVNYFEI